MTTSLTAIDASRITGDYSPTGAVDFSGASSVTLGSITGTTTFLNDIEASADINITSSLPTITFTDGATTSEINGDIGDLRLMPHSINRQVEIIDRTLGTVRGYFNLAQKGAYIYENGVGDYTGSGSPEGVTTAAVGSTYRRSDGGAGTSFYVKESGTGNTGWVAK